MTDTPEPPAAPPAPESSPDAAPQQPSAAPPAATSPFDVPWSDRTVQIGLGGMTAVLVGLWMNWATVSADLGSFGGGAFENSVSGMSTGDGKATLALAAVAAIGIALRKSLLSLIPAVLAVLLVIYNIADISSLGGDVPDAAKDVIEVGTGLGIWVTLAGTIALAFAGFRIRQEETS